LDLAVNYQRFLSPGFKPFNPIKLAEETEKIVTRQGGKLHAKNRGHGRVLHASLSSA
jgi:hypothetical protein